MLARAALPIAVAAAAFVPVHPLIRLGPGVAAAQSTGGVVISASELLRLRSVHTSRDYEIRVALPRNYQTMKARLPALYVLDASGLFGMATDVVRLLGLFGELPEMIVVGIAYPVADRSEVLRRRLADFTPTNVPQEDSLVGAHHGALAERSGNARAFARTLLDEIVPLVERRYEVDPARRVLWGYSLGGLFALTVLFESPASFRSYLVTSPSLWWDRRWIFRTEAAEARRRRDLPARLFLSVGALEESERERWAAMVTNLEALDRTIASRRYPGLRLTRVVFADETHLSVVAASLSRGLRTLLAP